MAEAFKTTWAGGEVLIPKAQVEAEAREAYHAGRTPNEACPYPFHTDAGLFRQRADGETRFCNFFHGDPLTLYQGTEFKLPRNERHGQS